MPFGYGVLHCIEEDLLEEMGYSVSEASNGSEALRDLDSLTWFCLLITDLAMPDMDEI